MLTKPQYLLLSAIEELGNHNYWQLIHRVSGLLSPTMFLWALSELERRGFISKHEIAEHSPHVSSSKKPVFQIEDAGRQALREVAVSGLTLESAPDPLGALFAHLHHLRTTGQLKPPPSPNFESARLAALFTEAQTALRDRRYF